MHLTANLHIRATSSSDAATHAVAESPMTPDGGWCVEQYMRLGRLLWRLLTISSSATAASSCCNEIYVKVGSITILLRSTADAHSRIVMRHGGLLEVNKVQKPLSGSRQIDHCVLLWCPRWTCQSNRDDNLQHPRASCHPEVGDQKNTADDRLACKPAAARGSASTTLFCSRASKRSCPSITA